MHGFHAAQDLDDESSLYHLFMGYAASDILPDIGDHIFSIFSDAVEECLEAAILSWGQK